MSDDFCLEHGYEFMKSDFGNPIPYCERCDQERQMPTSEQFKETAQRLRTIVEYGVSGALVGDNEIARASLACELVARALESEQVHNAFFSLLKSMARDC